jgi:hypothetical protein
MKLGRPIKRAVIVFLLVALVAIVAAVLWPTDKSDLGKTVTFSDGSTMTLRAVTYGIENRYPGDNAKERFLSMLPHKWTRKYLGYKNLMTSSRPEIVFWLMHAGPGPSQDPQLILCDSNGFEIGGGYTMMRLGATGNSVEGWAFPYWPRRDATFRLRIYERGKRYPDARLVGEFVVRNPTPGKYPTWSASPLPITNRAGDLTVTLFDLTAGVGQGSTRWEPAANATVSVTRVGFRLTENGRPTKDWEIVNVESSDATSNVIAEIWGWDLSDDLGARYAELRSHPWPAESAWKLRVGFGRTTNFESADLWTLHLPLSDSSATNTPVMQTNLHGVLLEFTGHEWKKYTEGEHDFMFRMKPLGTESRILADYRLSLANAVDNTGQAGRLKSTHTGWNDKRFVLNLSSNATSLDLTLAFNQTRYVEFLAPPRIASTNDPPPARNRKKQ